MLLMSQFCSFQRYLCCSLGAHGYAMGLVVCVVVAHFDGFCDLPVGCNWCYCCGIRVVACMSLVHHHSDGSVVGSHCVVGMVGWDCLGGLVCGCAIPILVCQVQYGSSCSVFHLDCVV